MGEPAHPENEANGRVPTPWAGPEHGAWEHAAPLPPPTIGGANVWPGFDPTSERFAAPSSARLRHLPPPRVVPDAVPLELDELEQINNAARRRPPASRPRHLTAAAPLDASEPSAEAAPMSATADRWPTTVTVTPAVADPVPVLTAAPASMAAPVAAASPTRAEADGLDDADGRDRTRWRPSVLAGSVAVFAVVSLLTAAWAHQRRSDDSAPVAASVTALAGAATTASPAPTSDPAATSEATTAPAPTVPATTVPAPTLPATTVPAPTSALPPTGAPATTVATVASTAPAPTTPASVLGTSVLNRELLDALGKGVLPTGQPWPRATFNNGKLVLTGAVPSPEAAAAMVATAGALATPDLVVNELVTDASAAPARYLLVRLFDTAVFDRGSTTLRKDSDVLIELWGKRLRDQPSATLVLVAHGDGTGTALAATRSKNALARVLATGGVAPEQVDAQWSAGAATGPRLDFAVPVS